MLHHKSHTADWDVRAYIGHAFVRILTTSWISVVKNHHPESSSTPLQKNAAVVFCQLSDRFVHTTQSTQQHIKQALCAADTALVYLGCGHMKKCVVGLFIRSVRVTAVALVCSSA
jgi:hypothetical protein